MCVCVCVRVYEVSHISFLCQQIQDIPQVQVGLDSRSSHRSIELYGPPFSLKKKVRSEWVCAYRERENILILKYLHGFNISWLLQSTPAFAYAEGPICNTFPVLNHKMHIICQRLRKHAKLKYRLLWQKCYSQYILLLKCPFRVERLFWPVCCHPLPISPVPLCHPGLPDKNTNTAIAMEISKRTGPTEIMFDSTQPKKATSSF